MKISFKWFLKISRAAVSCSADCFSSVKDVTLCYYSVTSNLILASERKVLSARPFKCLYRIVLQILYSRWGSDWNGLAWQGKTPLFCIFSK